MNIRLARASEAATLSELAMAAKAHWGYSCDLVESWRAQLEVRSEHLASQPTFVAVVDEEIAGFYALEPGATSWRLDDLWVLPKHMQRGVGRALLEHALKTAARGGAVEVTVDADPNAAAFYVRCGALRRGEVAAPIPGHPQRARPQLVFRPR